MTDINCKIKAQSMMRYWSKVAGVTLTLASVAIMGCADKPNAESTGSLLSQGNQVSPSQVSAEEVLRQARTNGENSYILADNIHYLPPDIVKQSVMESKVLTFTGESRSAVEERVVGDILISDYGRGFWKAIESIEDNGESIRFHTREAAIHEVVKQGSISIRLGEGSEQEEFRTRSQASTYNPDNICYYYNGGEIDKDYCDKVCEFDGKNWNCECAFTGKVGPCIDQEDTKTISNCMDPSSQYGVGSLALSRTLSRDSRMSVYAPNLTAKVTNAAFDAYSGSTKYSLLDSYYSKKLKIFSKTGSNQSLFSFEPAVEYDLTVHDGMTLYESLVVSGQATLNLAWEVETSGNGAYQGAYTLPVYDTFHYVSGLSHAEWDTAVGTHACKSGSPPGDPNYTCEDTGNDVCTAHYPGGAPYTTTNCVTNDTQMISRSALGQSPKLQLASCWNTNASDPRYFLAAYWGEEPVEMCSSASPDSVVTTERQPTRSVDLGEFAAFLEEHFGHHGLSVNVYEQNILLTDGTTKLAQTLEIKTLRDDALRFNLFCKEFVVEPEVRGAYEIYSGGHGKMRTGFSGSGYISAGYECDFLEGCKAKSRSTLKDPFKATEVHDIISGSPSVDFRARFEGSAKLKDSGFHTADVTPAGFLFESKTSIIKPYCPYEMGLTLASTSSKQSLGDVYVSEHREVFDVTSVASADGCNVGKENSRACTHDADCDAGEICGFPDNKCEVPAELSIALSWNHAEVDLDLFVETPAGVLLAASPPGKMSEADGEGGEIVRVSSGMHGVVGTCEGPVVDCSNFSPDGNECPGPCYVQQTCSAYEIDGKYKLYLSCYDFLIHETQIDYSISSLIEAELVLTADYATVFDGYYVLADYMDVKVENEVCSGTFSCTDFDGNEESCSALPGCTWHPPKPVAPPYVEKANFKTARMLLDWTNPTTSQVEVKVNYPDGSSSIGYVEVEEPNVRENQQYRVWVKNVSGSPDHTNVQFTLSFALQGADRLTFTGEVEPDLEARSVSYLYDVPAAEGDCTPNNDKAVCSMYGVNCGTLAGPVLDNCGNDRTNLNCGTCPDPGDIPCGDRNPEDIEDNGKLMLCNDKGYECGTKAGVQNYCGNTSTLNCTRCPTGNPNDCTSQGCFKQGVQGSEKDGVCTGDNRCCYNRQTDQELCDSYIRYAGDQEIDGVYKLTQYACGSITVTDNCGESRTVNCSSRTKPHLRCNEMPELGKPCADPYGSTRVSNVNQLDFDDIEDKLRCDIATNLQVWEVETISTLEHYCASNGVTKSKFAEPVENWKSMVENCASSNYLEQPSSCYQDAPCSTATRFGKQYRYYYRCQETSYEVEQEANEEAGIEEESYIAYEGDASCIFYEKKRQKRNYDNPSGLTSCPSSITSSVVSGSNSGNSCHARTSSSSSSSEVACVGNSCACIADEETCDEIECIPPTNREICDDLSNPPFAPNRGECGTVTVTHCDRTYKVHCGYCAYGEVCDDNRCQTHDGLSKRCPDPNREEGEDDRPGCND